MKTISLDGEWTVSQQGAALSLPAQVPGDVMTDLFRAKKIPDPYHRENELLVQWVGEADWVYQRQFKVTAALLREDRVLLQCEGLDTFADLEINGTAVASTENMHRTYAWDVKPLLKAGENTIRVVFRSVNDYTR
ncbi:MAG TPA: glycoside hydrolase family 2, partial [Verrucomicrobia bacterium]|nr:glycoside hydrolase family 2 [Verrucomicrobiota bacterium]